MNIYQFTKGMNEIRAKNAVPLVHTEKYKGFTINVYKHEEKPSILNPSGGETEYSVEIPNISNRVSIWKKSISAAVDSAKHFIDTHNVTLGR